MSGKVSTVVVSAPHGLSGKTLVAMALCALFREKGEEVQPFKKGPDYIDPSWLGLAAGRIARNLDLYLMGDEGVKETFHRGVQGATVAVIEGAMGLYDGLQGGSTARLAEILGAPVLLVVGAERMTESVRPLVEGFVGHRPGLRWAGVVLNRVSGPRHEGKLRRALEGLGLPVVGAIPKDPELGIAQRHLGLIPRLEAEEAQDTVERVAEKLRDCLDLEALRHVMAELEVPPREEVPKSPSRARIGVFLDRAFNFYYPENLEALERAGAELVFINSLKDPLPPVDGLYIGGGFPEHFLEELEGNRPLREAVREAALGGMPLYAECGGLLYLCEEVKFRGRRGRMAGVIPAVAYVEDRPQGHGYVELVVEGDNPFFPPGTTLRGHEFHHARLEPKAPLRCTYRLFRGRGIGEGWDGLVMGNVLGAFTHLHSLGAPGWAEGFVKKASRFDKGDGLV